VSTYPDHILRVGSQHLAELKRKAAEFERQLWDAHESLEQELEQAASATEMLVDGRQEAFRWTGDTPEGHVQGRRAPVDRTAGPPRSDVDVPESDTEVAARGDLTNAPREARVEGASPAYVPSGAAVEAASPAYVRNGAGVEAASPAYTPSDAGVEAASPAYTSSDAGVEAASPAYTPSDAGVEAASPAYTPSDAGVEAASPAYTPSDAGVEAASPAYTPDERTARLIGHGRKPPEPSHRGRNIVLTGLAIAIGAALITMLVRAAFRPGPSWPASVATVQRQIATACQNPDVRSEPSQVNFACNKATRQILWVFSLMTSGNNPDFASIRTGRQGLEPIRPSQGGQVAWSLNLHHPYNPANPIDSLQVAARAINNIIGGATLTAANGKPVVQPGLESVPANCARYTGSAAVTSRNGYPALCAKPITSRAGQDYLVADVFQKWMVGAPPSAAQDAAILFQNAHNPGDQRVLAILRSLNSSKLTG